MSSEVNLHATAIVIGTRGLLITGPSGSGKSTLAFNCLAMAKRSGAFAALVADDQVFVSIDNERVLARRPPAIAGMIELRGCGIGRFESVERAVMHLAIRMQESDCERLPPEHETFSLPCGGSLPLIRMRADFIDPLAAIAALRPELCAERPFC
ncbi:HPr kinase/phosphorylase [Rhizobium oryzicola]|uniref:HPr kinase/phosphatase C-terminal domain-containing protein n=1 Tax=Rhizobium oryzicola TaxID=1232668 RepID=A0ABT8T1S8_9HYPH|nr:HPr kinase/phosphatase C-terminal domain-containing protein [Rhizobium oryzicola]MDO1584700.1 HPr kinase/phosphatase C-terminal domain-containing protein [Rhizobium oryzicola]